MTPAMMREKLRIIQRRCSPNRPAEARIRPSTKRGGAATWSRAEEPVHADEPVPKPPHELERSDQQGEHAAEHMHAEGELVLEVGLAAR